MRTHSTNTNYNQNKSAAGRTSHQEQGSDSTFQFVDKRPEALAQRKMQEMASESPQVAQLKALQAMANAHTAQQQHPIQKKGSLASRQDKSIVQMVTEDGEILRMDFLITKTTILESLTRRKKSLLLDSGIDGKP